MQLIAVKLAKLFVLLVKGLQIIVCLVILKTCQPFKESVVVMRDMSGIVTILSVWLLILMKPVLMINMKLMMKVLLYVMIVTHHVNHVLALLLKTVLYVLKDFKR